MESYSEMVRRLKKPGEAIVATLSPKKADLIHMVVGVATEAGELLDQCKKHCVYNKDLDVDNVLEELGDIEFYLEGVRQIVGLSRVEVLEYNQRKLSTGEKARYKDGYSDEAAQRRQDKD